MATEKQEVRRLNTGLVFSVTGIVAAIAGERLFAALGFPTFAGTAIAWLGIVAVVVGSVFIVRNRPFADLEDSGCSGGS